VPVASQTYSDPQDHLPLAHAVLTWQAGPHQHAEATHATHAAQGPEYLEPVPVVGPGVYHTTSTTIGFEDGAFDADGAGSSNLYDDIDGGAHLDGGEGSLEHDHGLLETAPAVNPCSNGHACMFSLLEHDFSSPTGLACGAPTKIDRIDLPLTMVDGCLLGAVVYDEIDSAPPTPFAGSVES